MPNRHAPLLLVACCLAALAHGRELHQVVTQTVTSSSSSGTAPTAMTLLNSQTATAQSASPAPGISPPSWLSSIRWPTLPTTTTSLPSTQPAAPTNLSPLLPTTPTPAAPLPAGTAPAAPSQTVPSPSGGACPDPQRALDMHNAARAARGAAPLAWSTTLASGAQSWAAGCRFQHSGAAGLGENLYWNSASATCSQAVTMWMDEAPLYTGQYSSQTGHWTQIVWKATTAVGCGLARCGGATLVVCRYSPAGNVLGQFAANA